MSNKKKYILISCSVCIGLLLLVVFVMLNVNWDTNTNQSSDEKKELIVQETAATTKNISCSMKRVFAADPPKEGEESNDSSFSDKGMEDREYVVCEVALENNTEEILRISSNASVVAFVDGEKIMLSADAHAAYGEGKALEVPVDPGDYLEARVAFDVPNGWNELVIRIYPYLNSNDEYWEYAIKNS